MKKALITGISGQDGSYLADLLVEKGYEVHGMVRRSTQFAIGGHDGDPMAAPGIHADRLHLHYGDLADFGSIFSIVKQVQPDEVYNLGAMSDVRVSFDIPEYTGDVTGIGALRVFEAVRQNDLMDTRIYQGSSSEMFGKVFEVPQNEATPLYPRSPYAAAKVYAHYMSRNYRESYGMFISNGILFNHESPRRGHNFVTRKITRGIARILLGRQSKICLGNLKAKRDWGYAPEYVEAMWRMLQQPTPDDFVLATGETHSVEEFLEEAFSYVNLDWKSYVEIKQELYRPAEVEILQGDASKAKQVLGWEPKVSFKELVRILVDADIENAKKEV